MISNSIFQSQTMLLLIEAIMRWKISAANKDPAEERSRRYRWVLYEADKVTAKAMYHAGRESILYQMPRG